MQIVGQLNGTPGGAGEYDFFAGSGAVAKAEPMTETYGLLTVGSVTSGNVALGERITGEGVPPLTAIDTNVSGSGAGSQWIVNNAVNLTGNVTMTAPTFTVEAQSSFVGATETNAYFEIQPNGVFGFDNNPSSLSYMSPSEAATELGLTQASGAIDSSPGGIHEFDSNVHEQCSDRDQSVWTTRSLRLVSNRRAAIRRGLGGLGAVA